MTLSPYANADFLALLAGVCADPTADAPRLVIADWLEETGDEKCAAWAELIRLECEQAAWPLTPTTGQESLQKIASLRSHIRFLNARWSLLWRLDWLDALLGIVGASPYAAREAPNIKPHVHRGFVSRIAAPWQVWLEYADRLRSICPLESVELTTWPASVRSRRNNQRQVMEIWFDGCPRCAEFGLVELMHRRAMPFGDGPAPMPEGGLGRIWPGITFTLPYSRTFTGGIITNLSQPSASARSILAD